MKKLNPLTKAIHKYILREPDDNVVLLELVSNTEAEVLDVEGDDYCYKFIGDDIIFDSIVRSDNEPLFSLDFKFLDSIDKKIRNNKTVIDKGNLSPNMVFIKIRSLVKSANMTEDSELRVYFCDIDTCEVNKKLIFNIFKTDDYDTILLVDDFGDEYTITLGGTLC